MSTTRIQELLEGEMCGTEAFHDTGIRFIYLERQDREVIGSPDLDRSFVPSGTERAMT